MFLIVSSTIAAIQALPNIVGEYMYDVCGSHIGFWLRRARIAYPMEIGDNDGRLQKDVDIDVASQDRLDFGISYVSNAPRN